MTDEGKLHQNRAKGDRARALLEDPTMQAAFNGVVAAYMDEWKDNKMKLGPEGREQIWRSVQLIDQVKAHLRKYIDDGKLADEELRQLHPNHTSTT